VDTAFEAFCAAGLWPTLGRTTAGRLAAAHINSADDVTAEALERVEGVSAARAKRLVKTFAESAPRLEVATLLHAASLDLRPAFGAVDTLGKDAASRLREDPWLLLGVPGVEPREADRLALATLEERPGKEDPRRGRALVGYALARAARDGHTVVPDSVLTRTLAGLDAPDPAAALAAALDDGRVVEFPVESEDDQPRTLLGLLRYAAAEDQVADGLHRLLATADEIATSQGAGSVAAGLDPAQREAVQLIAAHGVTVLHGGPGTGKSRTVAALTELCQARGKRLALAAPTGRAAKRLEELTGQPATTLHRLLGAQGRTGEFARGESWPIDADVVVVDEASMLDVELAAALLDACADTTHLLLVGDPAQLPSIGPGRVLGDVLDSGAVPAVELTTLHRQAEGGTIARLASAVRVGELPAVDDPTHEVVVVTARSGDEAAHRVVQLVTDSIPRALGIDADEVQVVTPVHRGAAGTAALNAALKARLNPGSGTVGGFDVGDRVVATANHLDDGFANGEVGVVVRASDGTLDVEFGVGGPVAVSAKAMTDLTHGWAVTVHRAQGSEWPAVVVALPAEAGGMLSRPLVYTALTRAQRHLSIVHAAGATLARGVHDVDARPRRTRLASLLRDGG
jgi:exodeoxyribonuclease V alpha subunit